MSAIEFGIMYAGAKAIMMARERGIPSYIADYAAALAAYWFIQQVVKLGGV